MQHGQVALLGELPIDPARPHVIVAVDPANTLAESDESNNVASFRKLTLGVTVHGLALSGQKPAWIDQAGDLLERQGYAGTIRFDWAQASRLPVPGQGVMAGLRLADLIRQQAAQLATQPNDVIDVHLIGHSRGNTVITTALFALQAQPGPQALALGFAKLTLLDPHVARNQGALARGLAELRNRSGVSTVGLFSFAARSPQSRAVAEATLRFQAAAQDPPVVIAPNADAVEVFFQRLPWNRTISLDRLVGLNLWAEAPEAIINLSARPALFLNVSPFAIGHINVPDLYLALLSR
ncbi:MAG TPA: alpha/beta fold hydrolase [Gemmataceae bacterium]|nr:alpha/beta fold hydrolase [Gemmataceae bacterium]